ncbi:MAG: autotransporter outer membrane beta-barrel domain-containing protein [Gammaproteobacteria bacterium]|nr:autotransporter outer membrane beta-barrel domain-containing protein [Gammaproteobacteria bacterium]
MTTPIPDSAVPGSTVVGTFSIVNNLSTTYTTTNTDGSVNPASLPAGGGTVEYSLTIPATAIANQIISDTLTITDSDNIIVTTIPVSVTVVADTVSVTEITLTAIAGETATNTFTVSNALPTSITTENVDSSVDPASLPADGGSVTYSLTVPSTAADGEVITDTITISDDNNVTTIAVSLTVSSDLFAELPGLTDSEREVAHALDEACAALSGTEVILPPEEIAAKTPVEKLLEICSVVDSATIEDQVDAIRQITPKQAPAQGTSSVEVSQRQFDNITARMKALRSGATGISVSGLTLDYAGKALPINLLAAAAMQSGGSAGEGNTALLGKLGFFINGNLSFGEKDGSSNELGFDLDTRGITAGLDYRFTDQFIVGGSIGYVGSDTEFDSSRGDMDVKGYTLAVYSTYYQGEASYLDAILSYGWNDFDSSRKVNFLGISEEASGDTDGTELSFSLGGGYDFNRNALSFGPYGRINYINADIDGYTEDSSTGLELVYDDQEVESLTTLLGGQLSYAISTSRGVFTPQLRLEWAHEFKDDSRFIKARFQHDPTNTSFRLTTDDPDRDYFNLGAGVSATFGAGKSGYIYFETMLGQEDVKQHSLAAGFRLEF